MRRIDKSTRTWKVGYVSGVIIAGLILLAIILGLLWCVSSIARALVGA